MKFSFLIIALASITFIYAQEIKQQRIKSDIKSVIVYLDGAEISTSKKVDLKAGKNEIIFEGLTPNLNSKSIQFKATGDVKLLSITSKINYLFNTEIEPKIKVLKDSILLISRKNQALQDEEAAYVAEREMIFQNQKIGSTEKGLLVAELKLAADFYRSRLLEINNALTQIAINKDKNQQVINRMNSQLYELSAGLNYKRSEIYLLLEVALDMQSTIDLNYLVSEAGWVPLYDIKAEDVGKPIDLIYRAKVYNNTGIDWNNIKIRLSTADPKMSASKPELTPWYLNYKTYNAAPVAAYKQDYYDKQQEQQLMNDMPVNNEVDYLAEPSMIMEEKRAVTQMSTNIAGYQKKVKQAEQPRGGMIAISDMFSEFEIEKQYTIKADAKPYLIDVSKYNLPATYKYLTIPKQEKNAFLLARITGWEDLNLVPGNANIYFSGTFIGQSFINTNDVVDTLDLSLGRDNKIVVTRTKLTEFSGRTLISTSRKETMAYEISVKNNHKAPIDIDILDQLPVSQNSEIEVTKLDISGAEENTLNGELKWHYVIDPDQVKKVKLIFSVKYPKNKPVEIQKQTYRNAKFM